MTEINPDRTAGTITIVENAIIAAIEISPDIEIEPLERSEY